MQTGTINIRGKEYMTVALRVQMFRERFPDHALTTDLIERVQDCVVMRATITAPDGRIIATGHAEEYRASSQINKTSALENAETSAIGRALAAFGIGGTEFASANEVQNAIHQQDAGGHSNERSQPPATDDRAPRGRGRTDGPSKSELDAMEKEMVREIHACDDTTTLDLYLKTKEAKAIYKALTAFRPSAIEGPPPAGCPEYKPIGELILDKRAQFAREESNNSIPEYIERGAEIISAG